jgi:hypothetical protein
MLLLAGELLLFCPMPDDDLRLEVKKRDMRKEGVTGGAKM